MLVLHLSKQAVGFLSRHHLIKTNACYTAAFHLLSLHLERVFNKKKYSISKLGLIQLSTKECIENTRAFLSNLKCQ